MVAVFSAIEKDALINSFKKYKSDENTTYALAAMQSLMESSIKDESTTTMQEFIAKMVEARKILEASSAHVSLRSGCELFVRFITLAQKELEKASDFNSCRNILLTRGQQFIEKMQKGRTKVVENTQHLIEDEMVILTHSRSRCVLAALVKAAESGKQFKVFVTEAHPLCEGYKMLKELQKHGIECTVILDSAVSYIIEKERVSAVIIGAEGVCLNGGIINRIGTCDLATIAHHLNKPVYVLAESFKFIQFMPLNNRSLPKEYLYPHDVLTSGKDVKDEHPLVDYTAPKYITLLYTDMGILPTSAVTEYLIELYT